MSGRGRGSRMRQLISGRVLTAAIAVFAALNTWANPAEIRRAAGYPLQFTQLQQSLGGKLHRLKLQLHHAVLGCLATFQVIFQFDDASF